MLHLAQGVNLLSAIVHPYCLRPNFPQNSRYYPLQRAHTLEPFGEKALQRFIVYETATQPVINVGCRRQADAQQGRARPWTRDDRGVYMGECGRVPLHRGLFEGDPANQVDQRALSFRLWSVRDRKRTHEASGGRALENSVAAMWSAARRLKAATVRVGLAVPHVGHRAAPTM